MLKLTTRSLDWALSHVERYSDTDVFPPAFEYQAIRFDWDNVRTYLADQDILEWTVRPHRSLLAPKARYGFRAITQLDPLDMLVFSALIHEIGRDIERIRVPVDNEVVFSYRFQPRASGELFNPFVRFSNFQERSAELVAHGYEWVGVADIADFYNRIYHHRLENALHAATTRNNHVIAIRNLLSGWNGTETFGIPVGNAPSRLLAEITMSDVDEALLANDAVFVRYNDDYRFFARSHTEAYRHIAFLADTLYRNHGLTLQPQKTKVMQSDQFARWYLKSEEDREIDSLRERFNEILDDLGIDRYEPINYQDLTAHQQNLVDSLNLRGVAEEELEGASEPDPNILRFVLRRMSQLGDESVVDLMFDNIDRVYTVLPDLIRYLQSMREELPLFPAHDIGGRLLDLLNDSVVSELEYHRMWLLEPFTTSRDWNQEHRFFTHLGSARDSFTRRQLILAMGRASQRHWFQSQWRRLFDEPHWPRRAMLAGASCLPGDARRHWYQAVRPQLDVLETAVSRWAQRHPLT